MKGQSPIPPAKASPAPTLVLPLRSAVVLATLSLVLVWAYWPLLAEAYERWSRDPQYSHGFLVPVFALAVLWLRRSYLQGASPAGFSWWSLPLILFGCGMRFAGTYFYFDWVSLVSLLPCLAGVALLVAGMRGLMWATPAIGFLVFMIPLPFRVETALAQPLQRLAAVSATYLLQTLGFYAVAEGNTIRLEDQTLEIVDACSGLSMMMAFLALSTGMAVVVRRPLWEKVLLVGSALPIAVLVNVLRITLTGVLYQVVDKAAADAFFHDFAGWLMMPAALALYALELKVLAWALVEVPRKPASIPLPYVSGPPAPVPLRKSK